MNIKQSEYKKNGVRHYVYKLIRINKIDEILNFKNWKHKNTKIIKPINYTENDPLIYQNLKSNTAVDEDENIIDYMISDDEDEVVEPSSYKAKETKFYNDEEPDEDEPDDDTLNELASFF